MTEPKPRPRPEARSEARTEAESEPVPGVTTGPGGGALGGPALCPECGRDTADTSQPRAPWNSWRRLLPITLLALAALYVVLMATPFTRVWITGKDNSLAYPATYNGKPGFELDMHPRLVTPASLREIAEGTGSVDELRAMVEEYASLYPFGSWFEDPPTQMQLSVGTRSGMVDETVYYGFPFTYMYTDEGEDLEDNFDASHISPPLTELEYDFGSYWWLVMRGDAADTRFRWIGFTPFAFAAAIGLGWFVWSAAGWCSRRRRVRFGVLLVYAVLLGMGATYSKPSTDVNGFDPLFPLTPMGITRDRFLDARRSEAGLHELAGTMLAAIPEGTDENGIVYLGQLTPIASDWWQDSLGPIIYPNALGYYGASTYYRYDENGNPLGPAVLGKPKRVMYDRHVLGFLLQRGNTVYSLMLYPSSIVLCLTLLALIYSIPRWSFAFFARRRHKKRLRLGRCLGCGYHLPRKPA